MSIHELRKKTGLSQSQFAAKFHLSVRTLQSWEQGQRCLPHHLRYMMTRIIELEDELKKKDAFIESMSDDGR